jgi:hypothetical protein
MNSDQENFRRVRLNLERLDRSRPDPALAEAIKLLRDLEAEAEGFLTADQIGPAERDLFNCNEFTTG